MVLSFAEIGLYFLNYNIYAFSCTKNPFGLGPNALREITSLLRSSSWILRGKEERGRGNGKGVEGKMRR